MSDIICCLKGLSRSWRDRPKRSSTREEKKEKEEKTQREEDRKSNIRTLLEDEHKGYPQLAVFQTSQPQFSLYRSFSYLYSRTLLELQHELTTLEDQLDECDDFDSKHRPNLLISIKKDIKASATANVQSSGGGHEHTSTHPAEGPQVGTMQIPVDLGARPYQPHTPLQPLPAASPPGIPGNVTRTQQPDPVPQASSSQGSPYQRREVIEELKKKLKDYGELLIIAREVNAFKRPASRDYNNVMTWLTNKRPIIQREEKVFLKEDLITLHQGREWAKFDDSFVGAMLKFEPMQKWLKTPELNEKTVDTNVKLFDNPRVEMITGSIMTFVLCLLLVVPIVAMYALNVSGSPSAVVASIVVLVVFVLLFTLSMPLFTKAGRNEMFAASAAYCAVLVVFISNFSSSR